MTYDSDLKYWLGLSLVEGLGPRTFRSLYAYFNSAQAIWKARRKELAGCGLSEKVLDSLVEIRNARDLDEEFDRVGQLGIKLFRFTDERYPGNLKKVSNAPFLLYVKGSLLPQDELSLAVVGTRRFTDYGRRVTGKLVRELAVSGLTIVSGLALGIDSFSHRAALSVSGRTVAVLGCGLNQIYPPENRGLAQRISERGALVSEFPLGMPPRRGNFPARNRIISGLSLGVLICEAPERSGALITASCAAEQGRPVFAVPGSIFNSSFKGVGRLLQDGAKPVLETSDILSELALGVRMAQVESRKVIPETKEEAVLLEVLDAKSFHVDQIVRVSHFSTSVVLSTLVRMEMRGLIEDLGGGKWAAKK